jgi:hypothetical protein
MNQPPYRLSQRLIVKKEKIVNTKGCGKDKLSRLACLLARLRRCGKQRIS